MTFSKTFSVCSVALAISLCAFQATAQAPGQQQPEQPKPPLSFFVTSVGTGKGADLGGLAGADAHCQKLASAVGAGNKTWRAYLSTQAADGKPAVNARDRIGKGPWHNAAGTLIANDVAHLHGDTLEQARLGNNLSLRTVLTEKNEPINGGFARPNQHDILTGSQPDGTAYPPGQDKTCSNFTSSADGVGSARVGHFDRTGGGSTSWNSVHDSRGCSQANLEATGGAGFFYCFAIN
jgi:hypothetical protein